MSEIGVLAVEHHDSREKVHPGETMVLSNLDLIRFLADSHGHDVEFFFRFHRLGSPDALPHLECFQPFSFVNEETRTFGKEQHAMVVFSTSRLDESTASWLELSLTRRT